MMMPVSFLFLGLLTLAVFTSTKAEDFPTASPSQNRHFYPTPTLDASNPPKCELNEKGEFEKTVGKSASISYTYEMKYSSSFNAQELIHGVENNLGNYIIKNTFFQCLDHNIFARERRLRSGSHRKAVSDDFSNVVGISSSPDDSLSVDTSCSSLSNVDTADDTSCAIVNGGFTLFLEIDDPYIWSQVFPLIISAFDSQDILNGIEGIMKLKLIYEGQTDDSVIDGSGSESEPISLGKNTSSNNNVVWIAVGVSVGAVFGVFAIVKYSISRRHKKSMSDDDNSDFETVTSA